MTRSRVAAKGAARFRPSAGLRAAVSAKARLAAKEHLRARLAWHESAGRGGVWLSTKLAARSGGTRLRIHERSSGAEALALVRMLQTAFQQGGSSAAKTLLDLAFRSQTSSQPLPPELAALLASLQEKASIKTHGNGRAKIEGGAHARGQGRAKIEGGAHARGQGRAKIEGGAHARGQGQIKARAKTGARTVVDVHGPTRGEGHVKARGNGHLAAKTLTRGRVTVAGDTESVHAKIRPSAELRAALRAKAREAAKQRVRVRIAWHQSAGRGGTWVSTKVNAQTAGARLRMHERTSGAESLAFLRMLQAAFQQGGPAMANAMLEFAFAPQTTMQPLSPELNALLESLEVSLKQHANANGEAHVQLKAGGNAGASNGNGQGLTPAAAAPVAGAPSQATTPAAAAPGSTVPGSTVPGSTVPGSTVPGSTAPGSTAPGSTAPGVEENNNVLAELETGAGNEGASGGGTETAAGNETASGVAGAGNAAPSSSGTSASSGQLPFTGMELPLVLLGGLGALLAGVTLRRRALR